MSLRSMTGYGGASVISAGVTVEVELSSVNRKQMDIILSLPRPLSALEPRVEEEISKAISRGRITGDISVRLSSEARRRGVVVDEELARTYLRAIRRTAKNIGLKDDLGSRALLELPDVVRYEQEAESAEQIWPILNRALQGALRHLLAMRLREGRELQKDLEKRVKQLGARLDRVRQRAPQVVASYREKLQARLKAAGFEFQNTDERLLRELAFFADKSDITEEITRLDSHFKQAHKLMQSNEPAGRSLDFLAQEMFREINTIGSKANDTAILKDVVSMKAELERIREQVQNVE